MSKRNKRKEFQEKRGKKGEEKRVRRTPVFPGLDTVEDILAAISLYAAHNQARQVAVEVLFLLSRNCGLGGVGCREARGGGRTLDRAPGHLGGCRRSCFRAARSGQLEVQ